MPIVKKPTTNVGEHERKVALAYSWLEWQPFPS